MDSSNQKTFPKATNGPLKSESDVAAAGAASACATGSVDGVRRPLFDPTKLTVEELRDELRARGENTVGLKLVLVERLLASIAAPGGVPTLMVYECSEQHMMWIVYVYFFPFLIYIYIILSETSSWGGFFFHSRQMKRGHSEVVVYSF